MIKMETKIIEEMDSSSSGEDFDENSPELITKSKKASLNQQLGEELFEQFAPKQTETMMFLLQIEKVNQHIQQNSQNYTTPQKEFLRELVSKQKNRYMLDGFNLDLTYVTPNIIAMGFPAENFESLYRNSMIEVQRFFNTRHPQQHMIFNLCSERKYKQDSFYRVAEFPFDDHQPPPFTLIQKFCQTVDEWLQDKNHVAGVHCKAGKGRTGVMICCYLLFSNQFKSARDSMKYYGLIRTSNGQGVTIPSQIRYVEYFYQSLFMGYQERQLELKKVRLFGIPNLSIFGGCNPLIRIKNQGNQFVSKEIKILDDICTFTFDYVNISGDVLIQFFHESLVRYVNPQLIRQKKMFSLWINTSFVEIQPKVNFFKRTEIDSVKKDKKFKKFPEHIL
ncbi:hypothetical protein pb186bvf_002002 [Paramecium bursaria]